MYKRQLFPSGLHVSSFQSHHHSLYLCPSGLAFPFSFSILFTLVLLHILPLNFFLLLFYPSPSPHHSPSPSDIGVILRLILTWFHMCLAEEGSFCHTCCARWSCKLSLSVGMNFIGESIWPHLLKPNDVIQIVLALDTPALYSIIIIRCLSQEGLWPHLLHQIQFANNLNL